MNEKESLEYYSALAFLKHYNLLQGDDYKITEVTDSPDILCKNSKGHSMKIEVTLTEDKQGDIACALGRTHGNAIEFQKIHLDNSQYGSAEPIINSIQSATENLVERIKAKSNKDYGTNTALLIRDTSGVAWNWDVQKRKIIGKTKRLRNPYDKGIWIINRDKSKIFRIR